MLFIYRKILSNFEKCIESLNMPLAPFFEKRIDFVTAAEQ